MIVDLHSHVLPGIDDGSRSVEESVAMLQMEAEQGVRHVVATPHFYGHLDTPEHFLEKRNRAEESLREALEKYPDLPQIHVGAEVHYFRGISTSEASMGLTIGGNSCILIEMPYVKWPDFIRFEDEFYISKDAEVLESDIDDKVGTIESKSPRRTCKWVPVNNEAGKLPVGTDIYSLKDNSQPDIAAYHNGKYIYYEKITEDEFYTAVSICNE